MARSAAQHAPLKRAQVLAAESELALSLSLELVAVKIRRQRALLDRLPGADSVREEMLSRLEELAEVTSFAELRRTEDSQRGLIGRRGKQCRSRFGALIFAGAHALDALRGANVTVPGLQVTATSCEPGQCSSQLPYSLLEAEARIAALQSASIRWWGYSMRTTPRVILWHST